jgi:membrane protease YdiL (CAAX protease family)
VARRFPLTTFFLLAYGLTWALLPWAPVSIAVSLLALMGPAAAALITSRWIGPDAWRDLMARARRWRVPGRWYVLAVLMPLPITLVRSGVEYAMGAAGPLHMQRITALELVVFVLVAGEELGWRGFALPRVLARQAPWTGSVTIGVLWACWHLPLFYMPGMPQYGSPFGAYVLYVVALSVVLTVLAEHTGGSVAIATLFHGAVNTLGVVNAAATVDQRGWAAAASHGAAAVVMGVVAWRPRVARR